MRAVKSNMFNPFFYGNPVPPDQFINRRRPLQRIVNRILNSGQSTAIIAGPKMGKTSLLEYLQAPETQADLYGGNQTRLTFNFIDTQMLGGQFTQAEFWRRALMPLEQHIQSAPHTPLAKHYRICQQNNFGAFTLERFFRQLGRDKRRLVLLLDEFDLLLHHPTLNSAEFFGSLRALSSRSRGALTLVIASRQPLSALNANTQRFNPTGSPYFNTFAEIHLQPFPRKDAADLLERGEFAEKDRKFILSLAGRHPYLLQLTAAAMWDEINQGESAPAQRYLAVSNRVYQESKFHFTDTWRTWTPEMRKIIITVALAQIPILLNNKNFRTQNFVKDLPDFAPEIHTLKTAGWLETDDNLPGGYRIIQQTLLWTLADQLVRIIRNNASFEDWFKDQHLLGPSTEKERRSLDKAAEFTGGLLKQGVSTLIDAAVEAMVNP